jgi:hypothetical protein
MGASEEITRAVSSISYISQKNMRNYNALAKTLKQGSNVCFDTGSSTSLSKASIGPPTLEKSATISSYSD